MQLSLKMKIQMRMVFIWISSVSSSRSEPEVWNGNEVVSHKSGRITSPELEQEVLSQTVFVLWAPFTDKQILTYEDGSTSFSLMFSFIWNWLKMETVWFLLIKQRIVFGVCLSIQTLLVWTSWYQPITAVYGRWWMLNHSSRVVDESCRRQGGCLCADVLVLQDIIL